MPSRAKRSKRSKRSERLQNSSLSESVRAPMGTDDDSVLGAFDVDFWNDASKNDENISLDSDNSRSEFCDVSRMMDHDVNVILNYDRFPDRGEILAGFDNDTDDEDLSVLGKLLEGKPESNSEKIERKSSDADNIDDFLFEDSFLSQRDLAEFLTTKSCETRRNKLESQEQKRSEAKESFYGLPDRVKALIYKTKKITSLYDWQEECLNSEAVKNRKNLIYALPTSGGKTLVAEILMLKEILCNRKNVIFILPFVALAQEKVRSMAQFALELGFLMEEYAGGKGQYPPVKRHRKNSIYICTIEKAQGLIDSLFELKRFHEIGTVVVDELHLLGEDGGRGATLEGLLTKLMYAGENVHIVGMSATIGNLNQVAEFLKADVYTRNFRPVEIKEYVKSESQIWLVNLDKDPIFTDAKKINYPYSETADALDPDRIGGLVMDVVPNDSCLVFCSSRKNCENVALLLTRLLFRSLKEHKVKEKEELLESLGIDGQLCPILTKTIKFGVAYHHSGLTSEERRLLEDAFRDGTICVICCTSTLAAGVNLPARRVILRCPYVGNQFLNLSRYKQMIGRAGRAGMGEIGESILICKKSEIPKVQELLTSRMNDCLSTLHLEEDRGINHLILSSVLLDIASTRFEIHRLVASSFLGVQETTLDVDVKTITDRAIASLLKAGVLRVKRSGDFDPNITVCIQSQLDSPETVETKVKKKGKRRIVLSANSILQLSPLGRAAMKGSVDLQRAYTLYKDLTIAQERLVLNNDLHILYLVTPYDLANQLKPVGSVFYNVIASLPSTHMETPRALGINEATLAKLHDGIIPKSIEPRVINRFWLTLILYELWQHRPLYVVAEKYQVNRGVLQNLLNASATFANSIVRFCQELPEFWAFTDLLSTFSKKLRYCCSAELEILMELPGVKVARARQLFNAGYKTLQSIATAKPDDLHAKIRHFPKKSINQIITAANLSLIEKVENLRDEAAQVLEGLDITNFE